MLLLQWEAPQDPCWGLGLPSAAWGQATAAGRREERQGSPLQGPCLSHPPPATRCPQPSPEGGPICPGPQGGATRAGLHLSSRRLPCRPAHVPGAARSPPQRGPPGQQAQLSSEAMLTPHRRPQPLCLPPLPPLCSRARSSPWVFRALLSLTATHLPNPRGQTGLGAARLCPSWHQSRASPKCGLSFLPSELFLLFLPQVACRGCGQGRGLGGAVLAAGRPGWQRASQCPPPPGSPSMHCRLGRQPGTHLTPPRPPQRPHQMWK